MGLKCFFGHQWNGCCKCERCGKIRDERHNFVLVDGKCIEKCTICDKEKTTDHIWNDCKCERCGVTRDIKHKWVLLKDKCAEKCSICNKERSIEHTWNEKGRVCTKCGGVRREAHINGQEFILRCKKCNNDAWTKSEGYDDNYGHTIYFRCSNCGKFE